LCINQDDVQERNTQVGLMAQIYSKASLVISWLGPADKDSDQAIPLMQRLNKLQCFDDMQGHQQCSNYSDFMERILSEDDTTEIDSIPKEQYERLTRFLARQYFFRCWVLQEIMLARRICMLCGTEIVDFSDLQRIALLVAWIKKHHLHYPIGQALDLPIKPNRNFDHEKAILELFQDRWRLLYKTEAQEQKLPFTFEQLLTLARMSGCANPKDKIFALLGIVPRGAFGISVDYNKTTEQVYSEAIRRLVQETKNLNCLSWVTDRSLRRFPNSPTWVGEFDDKAEQSELAFASVGYNATSGSILDVMDTGPDSNSVLRVQGVEIGRIEELAEPWEWHGGRLKFDPQWVTLTLNLPKVYRPTGRPRGETLVTTLVANHVDHLPLDHQPGMDHFKYVVRRLTCAAVVRYLHYLFYYSDRTKSGVAYKDKALPFFRDLDMLSEGDDTGFITSSAEVRQAEQQSCTCKANLSFVDISSASLPRPPPDSECPYIADFNRPNPRSHPYRTSISDRIARLGAAASDADIKRDWRDHNFGRAANRHGQFRRLARTNNGYLGLVSTSCEVGDAVWLLQGANIPYILRGIGKLAGNEATGSAWEVVGDAYVHGVMQGEVWKDVKDQLVDIELV
jgi:hypothetical protein